MRLKVPLHGILKNDDPAPVAVGLNTSLSPAEQPSTRVFDAFRDELRALGYSGARVRVSGSVRISGRNR